MTVDELIEKLKQFDGSDSVSVAFGEGYMLYPIRNVWVDTGFPGKWNVVISI